MSLILEALRKSEAQRQLGSAPGLHSATPQIRHERRLPRWLVPALVLMAVGAMAWGLGRMAVPDPANGGATPATVALEEPLPLPLQPQAAAVDAAPPSATVADAPATAPARPGPPVPMPQPEAAPAPAPAAPPRVAQAEAPAAAPVAPQADTTPAPAPAPAPALAGDDRIEDADLLRLADLPASQRAALPELRITMHVYAEDRDRRFAIIDGRRVGEGALLPGEVVVDAIRRDGIVVDLGGRRVLLPRP